MWQKAPCYLPQMLQNTCTNISWISPGLRYTESMPALWSHHCSTAHCLLLGPSHTEPAHPLLLCVQEIESAVDHKLLEATFRTSLCITALTEGAVCPLGQRCCNAHSVQELRVDAAVKLKYLPVDYKLTLCESFCSYGAPL